MPHELVYSAKALTDLAAILKHVTLDSPREARKWVAEIEQRCILLCNFPELGVERPDLSRRVANLSAPARGDRLPHSDDADQDRACLLWRAGLFGPDGELTMPMNVAMRCASACVLLLSVSFARAADPTPEAPIREAYAITIRQLASTGPKPVRAPWQPPNRDRLMSKSLAALFARDDQFMTESGDMGHVGADPFLSGQDGEVKNLRITVTEAPANGRALVTASFLSFKQPMTVRFRMVEEGGTWKIDDIVNRVDGKDYTVRSELSQPYECGSFMKKPCPKP